MVHEISPSYYAADETQNGYILKGENFDMIPADAVGVMSRLNDEPLENLNSSVRAFLYRIDASTKKEMTLVQESEQALSANTYLGAIVSNDRQTVYWVNETKPLP